MLAAGSIRVVGERYSVFVDPLNGSNSNSGRSDLKPYLTIDRAVNRAPSGADIWLLGGTYPAETFGDPVGTRRTDYATIRPYPGHTVDFPALSVEGWSLASYETNSLGRLDWVRFEGIVAPTKSVSLRGSHVEFVDCRLRTITLREATNDVLIDGSHIGGYTDISEQVDGLYYSNDAGRPPIVDVTCRNTRIADCTVTLIRPNNGANLLFEDCDLGPVVRTTAMSTDTTPVRIHSDGLKVQGTFDGITMRRCFMHDVEGENFYIGDAGMTSNVLIENSAIVRVPGSFSAFKGYDSENVTIVNSTLHGDVVWGHPTANVAMFNNVIKHLRHETEAGAIAYTARGYNLIGETSGVLTALGATEVLESPTFANAASNDYRLPGASAGKAMAVASLGAVTAPTDDILAALRGAARDVGAFQTGPFVWP